MRWMAIAAMLAGPAWGQDADEVALLRDQLNGLGVELEDALRVAAKAKREAFESEEGRKTCEIDLILSRLERDSLLMSSTREGMEATRRVADHLMQTCRGREDPVVRLRCFDGLARAFATPLD